jgi:uncharacterized protein
MNQSLELIDYRRRVTEIYRNVREAGQEKQSWLDWRNARDLLFASHPQTPLESTEDFDGLPYFGFDPAWRVEARFIGDDEVEAVVSHSGEGSTRFRRIGLVEFEIAERTENLDVLWLDAYGGGLFIPFRDATNGTSTYGGGRYLVDTVKGADLGSTDDGLILDFNYAYHPSCVHSNRWSCPLSPPANTLDFEVTAGEKLRRSNST